MLFIPFLLGGFLLRRFLLTLWRRMSASSRTAEQLVQQWERCCLALHFIIIVLIGIIALAEKITHFIADHFQVILGNAHLLDRFIDLRNSQTPGAFQTVTLIECNAVFNFRNKQNRNILFAFRT